jgi:hypothetical protein
LPFGKERRSHYEGPRQSQPPPREDRIQGSQLNKFPYNSYLYNLSFLLTTSNSPTISNAVYLSSDMLTFLTPALLLLASAAMAQVETPSVVTFISMSPVPTTDGVFTVQTSMPSLSMTPCINACTQAPCRPCKTPHTRRNVKRLTLQRCTIDFRRLNGHFAWRNTNPEFIPSLCLSFPWRQLDHVFSRDAHNLKRVDIPAVDGCVSIAAEQPRTFQARYGCIGASATRNCLSVCVRCMRALCLGLLCSTRVLCKLD